MPFFVRSVVTLLLALALASQAGATGLQTIPTATPGVLQLAAPLDMPGLGRARQLKIFLPPAYATSGKRYPVLYMHDAQELFGITGRANRQWKIDETLQALAQAGTLELIVVAVDQLADKRMAELSPWPNQAVQSPEGRQYVDFIVKVVKPAIDSSYRTLADRANTGIMGSSMGGLISHYALMQYPEVFGKAGVFSPSYWAAKGEGFDALAARPARSDERIYMVMGEREGALMVGDAQRMVQRMKENGRPADAVSFKLVEGGKHDSFLWGPEFRPAILWLFAPAPAQSALKAP
ncbi:MAG: alpha/beta hydrolase-fold protein [Massilia sp.]